MSYPCPRCGKTTARGQSNLGGAVGGVAGALIGAALAGQHCPECGPIPTSEFPGDVRSRILLNSALMIGGAAVLIVLVIALVIALQ